MDAFQRHHAALVATAYGLVRNREEAEDLAQEAYLRYATIPEGEVRSSAALLHTIVRRLSLSALKRRSRRLEVTIGAAPDRDLAPAHHASTRLEAAEEAAGQLLERLNPQERLVYALHVLLELSHEEIARKLELSEGNCRVIAHRAREHMMEAVARFQSPPGAVHQLARLLEFAWRTGEAGPLVAALTHAWRLSELPLPATPLLGREAMLEPLCRALRDRTARLVTIAGPPGMGKTRLAIEAAARLLDAFPHGVHFVPLATVREPARVEEALLRALGGTDRGREPDLENLRRHLAGREVLVVIDNFEQVMAARSVLEKVLEAAPGVHLVVTSREVLGLAGERVVQVPALEIPQANEGHEPALLGRNPAVHLFVSRCRAELEGFVLTRANAADVAALCRKLEGIPLALEMAAGRIRKFTPAQLLEKLTRRLALSSPTRSGPPHQRTLRATLAWSFDLLEPEARTVLCHLGLFDGGCTQEALEAVMPAEVGGAVKPEGTGGAAKSEGNGDTTLVALLQALERKSLIQRRIGRAGQERYHLLEVVREFVLEHLEPDGRPSEARRRHLGYFHALARQFQANQTGAGHEGWLHRLEADHANLQAALARACELGEGLTAATLAHALAGFWFTRGHLRVGSRWLEAVLRVDPALSPALRADLLSALGRFLGELGEGARAREVFEASLQVRRQLRDLPGESRGLCALASWEYLFGRLEQARAHLDRAAALSAACHNRSLLARCWADLGAVMLKQQEPAAAARFLKRALALAKEEGDAPAQLSCRIGLAVAWMQQGRLEQAEAMLRRCYAACRRQGNPGGMAECLRYLAATARDRGDLGLAVALYRRVAGLEVKLGRAAGLSESLRQLVLLMVADGQLEGAARVAGAWNARQAAVGSSPAGVASRMEGAMEAMRRGLGEEAFHALWVEGRRGPIEAVVGEVGGGG